MAIINWKEEMLKRREALNPLKSIKSPINQKGRFCIRPFAYADIESDLSLRCCCMSWMTKDFGKLHECSIKDVWNSETAQKIRKSILEGTYEYCNWHQCPIYSNPENGLYSKEQLKHLMKSELKKISPWIEHILNGKTEIDILPAIYNFCYDNTCNLQCPSCRMNTITNNSGIDYQKISRFQKKLLSEINDHIRKNYTRISICGTGEPFASRAFKDILFSVEGANYPKLEIAIQTNGTLLDHNTWEKLKKIHDNIVYIIISIDAASENTYSQIRRGGNYNKLIKNLTLLSELRIKGKLKQFNLAFVVQKRNYNEMVDAVKLSKDLNADKIIFNLLTDWYTWTKKEFNEEAIWSETHKEFKEFMKVLENPIFSDDVVDPGNLSKYLLEAKSTSH